MFSDFISFTIIIFRVHRVQYSFTLLKCKKLRYRNSFLSVATWQLFYSVCLGAVYMVSVLGAETTLPRIYDKIGCSQKADPEWRTRSGGRGLSDAKLRTRHGGRGKVDAQWRKMLNLIQIYRKCDLYICTTN